MIKLNKKLLITLLTVTISFSLLASGCKKTEEPVSKTETMLGTVCTIKIYDHYSEKTMNKAFDRLKEIENKMSINMDKSEVIDINNASGKEFVKVSEDTFDVIKKGLYFSEISGGKFDITIGPVVKLWNIGFDTERVPEDSEIKSKLPLVNYKNVIINESEKKVMLKQKGMMIDLGGIAKGYAADEAVRVLKENGVGHAIVNLGGNVLTLGSKLDGTPWTIGVQNPFQDRGAYIGTVKVSGKTVVSSGIYERFFEVDGKRYHHILDTSTGYPIDNNLESVTIVTDVSINADGLSKAFTMGVEKGLEYLDKQKVDGIFVTKNREVYITKGLKDNFTITDDSFTLKN